MVEPNRMIQVNPYRELGKQLFHFVLDIACRRCSLYGLEHAYFPLHVMAGPLCRTCFIEWRGLSIHMEYGVLGVGWNDFPLSHNIELYGDSCWEYPTRWIKVDGAAEPWDPVLYRV